MSTSEYGGRSLGCSRGQQVVARGTKHEGIGLQGRPTICAVTLVMTVNCFLGIDIGSTTLKMVLLSSGNEVLHTLYRRTKPLAKGRKSCEGLCERCGACYLGAVSNIVDDFLAEVDASRSDVRRTCITGSQAVEALSGDGLDFVLLFSPRTARLFTERVRDAGLESCLGRLTAVCLSSAVAAETQGSDWARRAVAARPTTEALLEAFDASFREPEDRG